MAGTAWPFNETGTSGAPAYTARQFRQLNVAPFVAMGSAARPLGAKSGIRLGTPSSIATITGSGPYGYSVAPFVGILDGESNAAAGPYAYSFAAAETGSIVAAGAAARKDRLDVQISDSDEGDGSGAKTVTIVYTQGAATGGAVPAAPARSHALAVINVPTSGAPTITWAPEWSGDPGRWTFNTVAERDAYVTLIGSANVPVDQRATVIADSTALNNADYAWSGSTWLGTALADITTFGTGAAATNSGAHKPRVRRVGNQVFLYGAITISAGFSGSNILTVPTAFQPPTAATRFIGAVISSNATVAELALTGGVVQIPSGYITSTLGSTVTLPVVGSWWMD